MRHIEGRNPVHARTYLFDLIRISSGLTAIGWTETAIVASTKNFAHAAQNS